MTQKHWTREKLDQLENLYREGYTIRQLAHQFHGTIGSISKILTRYQLRDLQKKQKQPAPKHKIIRKLPPHTPHQHITWDEMVLWLHNMGITLIPDITRKEKLYSLRIKPTIKHQLRGLLCYSLLTRDWVQPHQVLILANTIRAHFNCPPFLVDEVTAY